MDCIFKLKDQKSYLSKNKCDDLSYKDRKIFFKVMGCTKAGIKKEIDLNGDGIRDLMLFF